MGTPLLAKKEIEKYNREHSRYFGKKKQRNRKSKLLFAHYTWKEKEAELDLGLDAF